MDKRRIMIHLGRWLGEYHLNERDLADMTGIPYDTVRKLNSGLAESINVNYLANICQVLELDITDILVREPGEVPPVEGRYERILLRREAAREERKASLARKRQTQDEKPEKASKPRFSCK